MSKIVCVVPSIRPASMDHFKWAWAELFEKHDVTLITVWDGERPSIEVGRTETLVRIDDALSHPLIAPHRDLFCRRSDVCRNIGFVYAAATMSFDRLLTFDDDVTPGPFVPAGNGGWPQAVPRDPIQQHLDVLDKRVPLGWMNTAIGDSPYLRGVPYGIRTEAPVMLSHGVWDGVPDFDGQTQLELHAQSRFISTLPYFQGPVPRGVLMPVCGMSLMAHRDAVPYLYYAPQGADSGHPDLHRFGDIFMGISLKLAFDKLNWAIYTGHSTVLHERASDANKNIVQERLGRQWLEELFGGTPSPECSAYFASYRDKADRYADLIRSFLKN